MNPLATMIYNTKTNRMKQHHYSNKCKIFFNSGKVEDVDGILPIITVSIKWKHKTFLSKPQ